MLAIHPDQVETINAAFTPSAADVEHARRVVAAFASGVGVASLDGKMLDQPHLKQARHVFAYEAIRAKPNSEYREANAAKVPVESDRWANCRLLCVLRASSLPPRSLFSYAATFCGRRSIQPYRRTISSAKAPRPIQFAGAKSSGTRPSGMCATMRPASSTPNRLSPTIIPDATSTPSRFPCSGVFVRSSRWSYYFPITAPITTGKVADIGR